MTRIVESLIGLVLLAAGFAAYTWLAAPLLASLETPVPPHIALARMGQGFLGIVLACWIGVVAQSFGRGPMVGLGGVFGLFLVLAVIAAYALEVQVPIRALSAAMSAALAMVPVGIGYWAASGFDRERRVLVGGRAAIALLSGLVGVLVPLVTAEMLSRNPGPAAELALTALPFVLAFGVAAMTGSRNAVTVGVMLGILGYLLLEMGFTYPKAPDRGQSVLMLIFLPLALPLVYLAAHVGRRFATVSPA